MRLAPLLPACFWVLLLSVHQPASFLLLRRYGPTSRIGIKTGANVQNWGFCAQVDLSQLRACSRPSPWMCTKRLAIRCSTLCHMVVHIAGQLTDVNHMRRARTHTCMQTHWYAHVCAYMLNYMVPECCQTGTWTCQMKCVGGTPG